MVDKIFKGDVITLTLNNITFVNENNNLFVPIEYEDDDVIVFNKPINMPCHPSRNHQNDTLANYFTSYTKQRYNTPLTFRPINRLDKDTNGLCIVCKNSLAAKILQENNYVKKEYTAVLSGFFPYKKGSFIGNIHRPDDFFIKREVSLLGQKSITEYELLKQNEKYSLVKFNLITGRTHQIRVHMSFLGYPLAGDDMYFGDCTKIHIQALCCNKVEFISPTSKNKISICINIPNFMDKLIN